MPNRFRAALNRLIWPGPGVGLALISDATMSTTQESAGALIVVLIGPRLRGLKLVAATAGAPGWTGGWEYGVGLADLKARPTFRYSATAG